jgi:hypothetical protein
MLIFGRQLDLQLGTDKMASDAIYDTRDVVAEGAQVVMKVGSNPIRTILLE